jgi:hypothetical protein
MHFRLRVLVICAVAVLAMISQAAAQRLEDFFGAAIGANAAGAKPARSGRTVSAWTRRQMGDHCQPRDRG